MAETETAAESKDDRVFLVVVDDTDEMRVALRYACRRAAHTEGRVALLYVVESSEFQQKRAARASRSCNAAQRRCRSRPVRSRSSICAKARGAAN
jgi:hypothetical protein